MDVDGDDDCDGDDCDDERKWTTTEVHKARPWRPRRLTVTRCHEVGGSRGKVFIKPVKERMNRPPTVGPRLTVDVPVSYFQRAL